MADRIIATGGSRTQGGSITLTGAVQTLPTFPPSTRIITMWIQNKSANTTGLVYIVDNTQGNDIAEVAVGNMFAIDGGNPDVIHFRGTAGKSIYWGIMFE